MLIYSTLNNSRWFSNGLPIGYALEVIKVSLHHSSEAKHNKINFFIHGVFINMNSWIKNR